jgi:S1-C subfamily serine protease
VKVDNRNVSTFADLTGYINTKRPNDKIIVTYLRKEKTYSVPVILSKNDVVSTVFKGIELENINAADKKKYSIDHGVKIKELNNERLSQYANDLKDAIILNIGGAEATDIETVSKLISDIDDTQTIQMELITSKGQMIRIIL